MEWKEYQIQDVCRLINGRAYSNDEMLEHGKYKIVRVGNLSGGNSTWFYSDLELPADKYCHNGDLLFAWACTFGPHIWKEDNTIFHYHIWKIVEDKDVVDRRFFCYYLKFATGGFLGALNGSVMVHITKSSMEKMIIRIPKKLEDQRRIASILSSLDRKIELNNKINADLEEMAQAIFKNWFVDFEPFKDGKFVDSELGMIPEGWKVISLNEILDNVSGYSYKGSELQSSNIAMATIKNFERKGGFKTEGYKEIVISKKIKETQFVNMFDVLVAHTDLTQNAEIVGNPAIVLSKGGYEKLIMSMDLTKVISKIDGVTNGLLYCILSTSRFKEHALGYVNGTTVLHMSKKAVPEYTCAFPKDINQIRDLCITLDSIYKRMAVTYDENSRLSLLRDTLLPRLMSGELEVPE